MDISKCKVTMVAKLPKEYCPYSSKYPERCKDGFQSCDFPDDLNDRYLYWDEYYNRRGNIGAWILDVWRVADGKASINYWWDDDGNFLGRPGAKNPPVWATTCGLNGAK